MIEKEMEVDIFQKVIQKLTFTPSILLSDLIRSGIELDLGRKLFDDIIANTGNFEQYKLSNEILKSRERYVHILSRVALNTKGDESPTILFTYPKIYSEKLKERQFCLYNDMAEKVGFSKIRHIMPLDMMKEICLLDGIDLNKKFNDDVYKYYPYFWGGEFNGVTFIEYVLLLNIYRHTQHRTLFLLNKSSKTTKDIEKDKAWKDTIIANINSPQAYKVYIDTFFEVFYNTFLKEYNTISEKCIRTVWLPDEYKKTRNAFLAVEKYSELQLGKIMDSGNWYEQNRAFELIDTTESLGYLVYQIIPSVWKTMLLKYDKKITRNRSMEFGYENIDNSEKALVVKYSRIIEEYISHTIKDCKIILNYFS